MFDPEKSLWTGGKTQRRHEYCWWYAFWAAIYCNMC